MKYDSLKSITKILESGSRPKGGVSIDSGTIPSLGAEHLDNNGGFNFTKTKFVSENFYNNLKTGKIRTNDILIVKDGATTGKTSIVDVNFPFNKAAINEHLFRLKIDPLKASVNFVYHYLRTERGQKQIMKDFRGATVGGISRRFIVLTKIPLPEKLEDQIRIAKVLTKAEELIAKRKESIRLLDELIKSTFLDMFGDPVKNEKGWRVSTIGKNFDVKGGKRVPKGKKLVKEDTGYPYIKAGNIKNGKVTLVNLEYLTHDLYTLLKRYTVKKGTVCITVVGVNIGDIGIVPDELDGANLTENANKFIEKNENEINNIYLAQYLMSDYIQKNLFNRIRAAGVPKLALFRIEQIRLLIPPHSLQNKFATIVEKIESIKTKYQTSLAELENLHGSLSQRAFKGELDLSSVEVELSEYKAEANKAEELSKTEVRKKTPTEEIKGEYQSNPVLDYINNSEMKTFTFQDVWEDIKQFPTTKYHDFNELKKLFVGMLENQNPQIRQVFVGEDQLDKNKTKNYSTNRKIEKLIAFELVK